MGSKEYDKISGAPWAILIVLGAIALAAILFTGCKSTHAVSALPIEKQATHAELETQIVAQEKRVEAAEALVVEALESGKDAAASGDMLAIEQAIESFEAARAKWQVEADALDALVAKQNELIAEGAGNIAKPFLPFVPAPLQPLVPLVSALAVPALFKRPREHMAEALKRALKGQAGDFISYLGKAYGLKHSSYAPEDLLDVAASLADKQGKLTLAQKARAARKAA